jgi:dipeptidyl aminopeptidase/acylaminoacyl peptidase
MFALRVPSDARIAPDGGSVFYVERSVDREQDRYRSTIWRVSNAGGAPTRITDGDADSHPRWSPDGSSLAFLRCRAGISQVWLVSAQGGPARPLTDLAIGAGEPVWSPDGRRIAFAASERPLADEKGPFEVSRLDYRADGTGLRPTTGAHLFVADVASGSTKRVVDGSAFRAAPGWSLPTAPVWSPDGGSLAHTWSAPADDRDVVPTLVVHVVSADGGVPRRVTPAGAYLVVADWSPDGSELLLTGQDRFELAHTRLFAVPASGGPLRRLASELDRSVEPPEAGYPGLPRFAHEGERVVFGVSDEGSVHLYSIPTVGGDPLVVVGGERRVEGFTIADGGIAMIVRDRVTAGEVETCRLDGTGRRRLTNLFTDTLPDVGLVEPEERQFQAVDGARIPAWILRGTTDGPAPLLLSIHGGPHMAWSSVFNDFYPFHQTLAARGWTVLLVNPRGSNGYGADFFGGGAWGVSDEGDLLSAVDALIDEGIVDRDRVAVTGYSYGGYMTCLLTARHDRFRAAVTGGAITDLPSAMWSSDLGWLRVCEQGSDPWSDPGRWRERSPITDARKVRAPTLILHGLADDRCPINQGEAWFFALRASGTPVEMVVYPGTSHDFSSRPSHHVDYCRRVEAWLERHCGASGQDQ